MLSKRGGQGVSGLVKLVSVAVGGAVVMAFGAIHVHDSRAAPPPVSAVASQAQQGSTAVLHADSRGHFMADLQIRGVVIRALVDTGASVLAFSAEDAARFGLKAEASHPKRMFQTANGVVTASLVRIPEVRLQGITLYDVEASIMPPGALKGTLLGMSFLKKLRSYESRGASMVLRN
jgi:aspartyl protease family protein